jgi:hypothetical protein
MNDQTSADARMPEPTPTHSTLAEQFLGRALEKEQRAGVEHYVVGQHYAELQGPPEDGMAVAQLSYISPLGAVVLALVSTDGKPWEPAIDQARVLGTSYDYGMRPLPANFEITLEMRAALRDIEPPRYLPDFEVPDWVKEIAANGAEDA